MADGATLLRCAEEPLAPQDGYREGITAGKEAALQEGFDDGFANVGVPLGHQLGRLRGLAAGLLAFLENASSHPNHPQMRSVDQQEYTRLKARVQAIAGDLGRVSMKDIAPPDLQAEEHARAHSGETDSALDASPSDPIDEINSAFGSLQTIDSRAQRIRRRKEALDYLQELQADLADALRSFGIPVIAST